MKKFVKLHAQSRFLSFRHYDNIAKKFNRRFNYRTFPRDGETQ